MPGRLALKGKGVDCLVVSAGGTLDAEFRKRGIETRLLDIKTKFEFGPKVLRAIPKIFKIIKEEKTGIIHAHTRVSQALAFFASRIAGVPYVTTCHGFFKKRLGRRLFDLWGEKVIAISEPVKDSLINDFKVAPQRVELIYNGVEIDRFSRDYSSAELSEFKRSLRLKDGPIVGTIGRLSPVKGQRTFIEAIKDVICRRHMIQAIIMGDGPEEIKLKKLVSNLGIEESVQILKSDPDTSKYLAIMDIFVFPSIKEGLGISLLEAMVSGKPCVASDVGGIKDLIKDGSTGILFPVGDVKTLSDSIIRLLDDEVLRKQLGKDARILATERFSLPTMADRVLNLYKKMLESHANQ
ncbi:MAG: glycosyltransferase family 4 protein [Candidatus Omnitrophica bacterium]|nr:glycosyltransferase family 4 protein [Candidatus Omnitrophota bacterium]